MPSEACRTERDPGQTIGCERDHSATRTRYCEDRTTVLAWPDARWHAHRIALGARQIPLLASRMMSWYGKAMLLEARTMTKSATSSISKHVN